MLVKPIAPGALQAAIRRALGTPEAVDAWERALQLDPSDQNAAENLRRVGR